jgi:hypothetical protein
VLEQRICSSFDDGSAIALAVENTWPARCSARPPTVKPGSALGSPQRFATAGSAASSAADAATTR